MNNYRRLLEHFKGRKPLLNIILDGYGIGKQDFTDGIHLSEKKLLDELFVKYPNTQLYTHGPWVGLPSPKDMGGSEVGHLTIGAGRIIQQGASLIKQMIDDRSFFEQPTLKQLYQTAQTSALHLVGLLSDGNVHSHIDHFRAVIQQAAKLGVKKCYIHALLDGRDTPIQSALEYIEKIEKQLAAINNSRAEFDYRIVSGGGRETITMDRAKQWDRVELGWRTHVMGDSGNFFKSATEAIKQFRRQQPGIVDQDLPPFNIVDSQGKTVSINDSEAVLFMNFRADRAIEFTRAFCEQNFAEFEQQRLPNVFYAGMMIYDEDTNLPRDVVVHSASVENPFPKRILEAGLKQFRLAETQKYPHVTFFFNGGYRLPLDPNKEDYCLIESDRVKTFAEKPKMKAAEIAEKASELIDSGKYDYGLINLANPDMVGHTGDMEAVKIAIQAVDQSLAIILDKLKAAGGVAIVTADHGNADEMLILNPKTKEYEPSTKHSLNPVPLAIFDPLHHQHDYKLRQNTADEKLTLATIAATNYIMLGLDLPDDLERHLFDV